MIVDRVPQSDLHLVALPDHINWDPTEAIRGRLTITNASTDHTIELQTGNPALGTLTTDTGTAVGNNNRPRRGTGRRITLLPGATTSTPFICTTHIDSTRESTLREGDYLLTVHLRVHTDDGPTRLPAPALRIHLHHHNTEAPTNPSDNS